MFNKREYIKYLAIYLFLITCIIEIKGQSYLQSCKDEVKSINSMKLSKAYLVFGREEQKFVINNLSSISKSIYHYSDTLYYDDKGKIRKIVSNYSEGGTKGDIYYFDAGGYLRFRLHYDYYEGDAVTEELYMQKNEFLLWKGETCDDNGGYPITVPFFIKKGKIPREIKGIPFAHIAHLDSLKKQYNNDLKMPEDCLQVGFSIPEVGSSTFVNAINAEIRTSANSKSTVIDTLKMGTDVLILERTKDENMKGIGSYPWYKIEYTIDFGNTIKTGYIFGAFLEPIEKEVRK